MMDGGANEAQPFLQSLRWNGEQLELLDQRKLPEEVVFLKLTSPQEVWEAIRHLAVRGAPAIGMAAAFAVYLGIRGSRARSGADIVREVEEQARFLADARPTAVNLSWALRRTRERADSLVREHPDVRPDAVKQAVLQEALLIQAEDERTCRMIGEQALPLFADGMGVLTHCNAGGLATAKYGTALAPFYLAKERGIELRIFADETRPVLQGARLTAFELTQAGIDVTLICDSMAAAVMAKGWVQAVIVGTDRVAANGDVANKIGTYGVAVLAKAHRIPFYVACPLATIDLSVPAGGEIPIEERPADEIVAGFGKRTAPKGVKVYNPAFDITPHEYVTAIITEKGIVKPPFEANLAKLFQS